MKEKDFLYPLRKIHGDLYENRIKRKENKVYLKYLIKPRKNKIYILCTPVHTNIGDSAIVLAEIEFLKKCGFELEQIKEVTRPEYKKYWEIIRSSIKAKYQICWHGGGNLGDQWIVEELIRRQGIKEFSDRKMLMFPQTIHYTSSDEGKREQELSIEYYNNKKMILFAREQKSYEIMQTLYPNADVILMPDIVLSTTKENYGIGEYKRDSILLCMRNDKERAMTEQERMDIMQYLQIQEYSWKQTDMCAMPGEISKEKRYEVVQKKMNEFAKSRLVITDRLHGMVFAAISETPCIVFGNCNHKVKGTYEWLRHLPYIKYVECVDEAKTLIPEMLTMKNCYYDNTVLLPYFEKLKKYFC